MRPLQTKKEKIYKIFLIIIVVILFALHIDAIFFRDRPFSFNKEISLEGLISLLVTIVIALYIAHVVEEGREQKHSQKELLERLWQTAFDSITDMEKRIEKKESSYLFMANWPKRMISLIDNAAKLLASPNGIAPEISEQLQGIKEDILDLRKTVTTITKRSESPDDYLEVKKNMISAIAPRRQEVAMSITNSIQAELFSIWTDTIMEIDDI